ncbi:hypothetical protein [Wenyingzhuangia sp. IMCC45574]
MKIKIATVFILMVVSIGFSQSDYRKGYIVNHDNDTIQGFISHRGDVSNSRKCYFKKELGSETIKYSPKEINAYRFDEGKYYVAKQVNIDNNTKNVFLEFLVNGVVKVYYLIDLVHHVYYFIEDKNGVLHELQKNNKIIENGQGEFNVESNQYKGILKFLFKDGEKTLKKVDNIYLSKKSLINISEYYHNEVCTDGTKCIVYKKKKKNTQRSFGFIALGHLAFVDQTNVPERIDYLEGADFETSFYPSFGVYYKQSIPSWSENIFFQANLFYSKYNLSTYIDDYHSNFSSTRRTYDVDIDVNSIDLDVLLKFELNKKFIKPNFHIGTFGEYKYKNKFETDFTSSILSSGTILSKRIIDESYNLLDSNLGFIVGVGIRKEMDKKEINIDLSYKRSMGHSNFSDLNIIYLTLGFGFLN